MPISAGNTKHPAWGHLYRFAAVTLAVFVFTLAVGRLNHGPLVATARLNWVEPGGPREVSARHGGNPVHEPADLMRRIASDDLLAEVARDLGIEALSPEELRASLELERLPDRQAGPRAAEPAVLALRFRHADGTVAREFVNRLAHRFAQQALQAAEQARYRNPYEDARQAADAARLAWEEAEEQLRREISRHRKPAEQPATATVEQPAAEVARSEDVGPRHGPLLNDPSLVGGRYARAMPSEAAVAPASTRSVEPRPSAGPAGEGPEGLARLDSDLAELRAMKKNLQGRLDADHPMLLELTERIDTLSARLAALRPESGRKTDSPSEAATGSDREADDPHLVRLRRRAEAAETEYVRLAERERKLWMRQMDELRVPRWIVADSDRARRERQPVSPPMIAVAAGLGLAAGVGMLGVAAVTQTGFSSAAEAEAVLPVPVVGRLPARGKPAVPHGLRRAARPAVPICEAVLALFLVAMLVAAMLDGDFAATLRQDPLAALADGTRHLASFFWRS